MKMSKLLIGILFLISLSQANAQSRFDKVEINAKPVVGPIHALFGAGGNIGVSAGDDGILIVDDQYAPLQ